MDTKTRAYFDYAASTPVDERVLAAMLPFFSENYGNPSSLHYFGQQAEAALEGARESVARSLHCRSEEIIFTACGTESDNLALRGMAFLQKKLRGANRLVISPVEHHAVSSTARQLADEFGFEVDFLPVDDFGMVNPDEIEGCLKPDTAVVSVVYANNEIGTINPIAEIGAICRKRGIPLHTDAVQAAAHLPMDVQRDQVDLLAIGAHKFYGPKGIGALFTRRGTSLLPIVTGGQQESGLRAGTQNVPYIVGLAEALRLAQEERQARVKRLIPLRDALIAGVLERVDKARLTGHPSQRLPNHASFVFKGVDANTMLMLLDMAGFACSSGSACKAGIPHPSDILTAIGLSPNWALGSLRVTLGKDSTHEQVEAFLKILPGIVEKSRKNA
ncbi:MAG: cysteine desulfurase family protein [Anaerolineaceae bacterium]